MARPLPFACASRSFDHADRSVRRDRNHCRAGAVSKLWTRIMAVSADRTAKLYRMVTPQHTCPWGLKALDLLKREGFEVEDHHLKSRQETDDFKVKHQVETTPKTFIGGRRVGGYDDLRQHLGKEVKDKNAVTYKPVFALFGMAPAMALAASWAAYVSIGAQY
jgi:glutaredoxin